MKFYTKKNKQKPILTNEQILELKERSSALEQECKSLLSMIEFVVAERDEAKAYLANLYLSVKSGEDLNPAMHQVKRVFEMLRETGTYPGVFENPVFRALAQHSWKAAHDQLAAMHHTDVVLIKDMVCPKCNTAIQASYKWEVNELICPTCHTSLKLA